jgi:2-polyprenyl-3-methyl-5-hydroxy-6-metoxy-1,4-benzoquinol methylase
MTTDEARQHVADEEARRQRRVEAGRRSCKERGVGPNGGYCLTPEKSRVGGNYFMPRKMAGVLGALFANSSVLDLGCGIGQYGRYFAQDHPSVRWMGIDGAERVEEVTNGLVRFADLSEGLPLFAQTPWDWTMSIEVAEHVPRAAEPVFVHSLIRWAREGVILSWAPPPVKHQSAGHHHVSCKLCAHILAHWTHIRGRRHLFSSTFMHRRVWRVHTQVRPMRMSCAPSDCWGCYPTPPCSAACELR